MNLARLLRHLNRKRAYLLRRAALRLPGVTPYAAPPAAALPAGAPIAPGAETALLLYCGHELGVVESYVAALEAALRALGCRVIVVDAESQADLDACAEARIGFRLAIALGALPLARRALGRPVYEAFGERFLFRGLDSIIFDLARVPASLAFLEAMARSPRLGYLAPERDYACLVGAFTGSAQIFHAPFAGFHELPSAAPPPPRAPRLAVVGTVGQELADSSGASLAGVVEAHAPAALPPPARRLLVEAIEAEGAPTNVTRLAADLLRIEARALFSPEWLPLLTHADAFEKRRRRILAARALQGLPVDFFGVGWQQHVPPGEGFAFHGPLPFPLLARLFRRYAGMVNFDPNWDDGLHDRVYTAIGAGCRVLTNANRALAGLGPPAGAAQAYDANHPRLAEAAASLLAAPPLAEAELAAFRTRHSWTARVDRLFEPALSPA